MTRIGNSNHAILFYGGFAARSGGAFMHATTLSEGLRARGWSVSTVTLDNLPLFLRYLPHIIARVVNRLAPPLGFYYKGVVTRFLYKYFIRYQPDDMLIFEDIYLTWNSNNPSATLLHAVWSDNLQSFEFDNGKINSLKSKEVSCIGRINHPVITVSKPYRNYLQQIHFRGFDNINLDVVELGLNVDTFRAAVQMNDRSRNRSLVYCGALEARKNVYFMLDVFKRIRATDPTATLTIIGDGPDRNGLARYAEQSGLSVTFLGRLTHEQVLEELQKHNIYIHTALKESFSFALLEAKLSGLTTCALSSLEVPEEFIDVALDRFNADNWSSRILAINGRPDIENFPDYSIARMTDLTLALVSTGSREETRRIGKS